MDHSKQVAIIKQLLEYVDAKSTTRTDRVRMNPASAYTSSEILQLEQKRFFLEHPLVAGLSGDLRRPGSFVTQEALGVPFILLRGRDGHVRAFLNSCRHRGTRLVSDARGEATTFSCPFHAWNYDLEGRLVGIPRRSSFGDLDHPSFGLVALPAVERYGIIWIKLQPGPAIDIDAVLGGLGPELAGWDLDSKFAFDSRPIRKHMNWKLANDTFGETYHFEILHRKTLDPLFYSNIQSYETFGSNHRMVFAQRTIDSLRTIPEEDWTLRPHSTIAYFLFPNTQLLVDPRSIEIYRIFPEHNSVDRSCIVQSVYLDHEPVTGRDQDRATRIVDELMAVIVDEDFAVAESAQDALSSGLLPGVVYGRNEPALHHYHSTFRTLLNAAPLEPVHASGSKESACR